MRFAVVLICLAMGAGCAGEKRADANDPWRALRQSTSAPPPPPPSKSPATKPKPIVTPSNSITARVMSVNLNGGFVVLNFPIGAVPASGHRLSVYRNGLKVAELRVGEQRPIDFNVIADITAGQCQIGDEVRDN